MTADAAPRAAAACPACAAHTCTCWAATAAPAPADPRPILRPEKALTAHPPVTHLWDLDGRND